MGKTWRVLPPTVWRPVPSALKAKLPLTRGSWPARPGQLISCRATSACRSMAILAIGAKRASAAQLRDGSMAKAEAGNAALRNNFLRFMWLMDLTSLTVLCFSLKHIRVAACKLGSGPRLTDCRRARVQSRRKPVAGAVADVADREHDGDFDQDANDRGQGCTRVGAE